MGGIFAIIVLFLFLQNYRSTVIIGTSIPLAIITTFGLLKFQEDITLNLMTLGGLALGIGMMVDNAIVVMENIYRFFTDNPGGDRKELAIKATEEVLMPVIASTATTVAVFLPIGFIPDMIGDIFFNMSLAIIYSLLASLVVAVTFVPMLCSRFMKMDGLFLEEIVFRMYMALAAWLRKHPGRSLAALAGLFILPAIGFYKGMNSPFLIKMLLKTPLAGHVFNPGTDSLLASGLLLIAVLVLPLLVAVASWVFNQFCTRVLFRLVNLILGATVSFYVVALRFLLQHWFLRLGYCGFILALFLFSIKMQPAMTFFPAMDRGEVNITFETPEGTSVEKSDEITRQIEKILLTVPEIKTVITSSSVGRGSLAVKLKPDSERQRSTNDVIREVRDQVNTIPGIRTINYKEPGMGKPSHGKSIQIEVMGDDFAVIEGLCQQIHDRIKDLEGIKDLESGVKSGRPEVRLVFDREKIRDMGLSLVKISEMARSYVYGSLAGKYREKNDEFDIRVEAADLAKDKIARLKDLEISLEDGKFVKLSQIAEFKPATGYSTIERKNNARRLIVQADPDRRAIGAITADINERIKDIQVPAGYTINFGGENEDMLKAFMYLAIALIASVLLVYMIMAAQFESLLYPFLIMFTIPLSYIGVVGGLRAMGFDFSVTAMIGIIMLAGIAVNNGIILIEYILQRRRENNETDIDAAVAAGKLRFRPIIMTVFTTLLGMIPLALGLGAGSDFYQPLAIVVSAGLFISTLLTLTFVPTIFVMAENIIRIARAMATKLFE